MFRLNLLDDARRGNTGAERDDGLVGSRVLSKHGETDEQKDGQSSHEC